MSIGDWPAPARPAQVWVTPLWVTPRIPPFPGSRTRRVAKKREKDHERPPDPNPQQGASACPKKNVGQFATFRVSLVRHIDSRQLILGPARSIELSAGEYLHRSPVTSTRSPSALALMARVSDGFSLLLLILIRAAIEFVTIPFAQYAWTRDQFLRHGEDFDLSLLVLVAFTCLPLLLAEPSGRGLNQLLTIQRLSWFLPHDREWAGMNWDRRSSIPVLEQLRNRAFSLDCPPFFKSGIQAFPAAHLGRTGVAILGFLSKEATTLDYFCEGK